MLKEFIQQFLSQRVGLIISDDPTQSLVIINRLQKALPEIQTIAVNWGEGAIEISSPSIIAQERLVIVNGVDQSFFPLLGTKAPDIFLLLNAKIKAPKQLQIPQLELPWGSFLSPLIRHYFASNLHSDTFQQIYQALACKSYQEATNCLQMVKFAELNHNPQSEDEKIFALLNHQSTEANFQTLIDAYNRSDQKKLLKELQKCYSEAISPISIVRALAASNSKAVDLIKLEILLKENGPLSKTILEHYLLQSLNSSPDSMTHAWELRR